MSQHSGKARHRTFAKIGSLAASKAYKRAIESDEQVVAVIRKHLIGLLVIYLQVIAGVAALLVLPALMFPDLLRNGSAGDYGVVGSAFGLLIVAGGLIVILATSVYRQSQLVLTDKSLIQTLQYAIFNRKVSRLALSDIEDVTYEQKGIVQTLVNYGTLHIETAGELKNFAFKYCPNPEKFAKLILEARQRFTNGLKD
jgi:uncharacterized membrane protein YdbT with pleckstrin-like domain